jgi:AcrR family transcriptional regulator
MNEIAKKKRENKSRQWILESLLSLMEREKFSQISIKEITANALLSRRTFYRNFNSKEDILVSYITELCNSYMESLNKETDLNIENITKVFFTFWHRHIVFLQLLSKNNLSGLLQEQFNLQLPGIHRKIKNQTNEYDSEESLEYALTFSAGGYVNLLFEWVNRGAVKKPDELAGIICRAMVNIT